MISVSYSQAGFQGRFNEVLRQAQRPEAVLMAAGRELSNQLRSWFRRKDAGANHLSTRRSHFWLQVMRSVNAPEQTGYNAVSVRVSDPRYAQKVFGGPIVPKKAGALAIPVGEEAYDRTPATFEAETGLRLFLVKTGKGAFERAVLAVRNAGKGFTVEYLLVGGVDQEADATAMPPREQMERAILERAQKVVSRESVSQ